MVLDQPKAQLWQDYIAQQQASGMSISAFCRLNEISEARFYYWRKALRQRQSAAKKSATTTTPLSFVEVKIEEGNRVSALRTCAEVALSDGLTIRILDGCSECMASRIIRAASTVSASC